MRRLRRSRLLLPLTGWLIAILLAVPLDRPVYRLLLAPETRDDDWHQALRQLGYLPTWLVVACLIWLFDRRHPPRRDPYTALRPRRRPSHRAGLLALSATLAGLAAELLKALVGRLRPDELGVTRWGQRPYLLWAEHGELGLGLPSSHTAVAFGAAGMVARLWPVWRWPMLILAAGCGLTRMMAGAHVLSDVVAAAGVALAVAWALYAAGEGPRRGPAGGLMTR